MINIGLARNTQTRGWHKISKQLDIIDVPGDHHSMLKVNEFDLLVSSLRQLVEKNGEKNA
jgi:thioesterase domain-containing protein